MLISSKEPIDPFINNRLADKYQVNSLIGEGGMSMVYEAIQDGVGRRVAIKVLKAELLDDDAYLKRFQREAKAISELSHPNLVSVYDLGTAPSGQPYMVLEFLDGVSISQILEDSGPVPFQRALPIFTQVCDVMEYAHRQGIIHRDLKPSNIMLINHPACPDLVKVLDFGILKYDSSMHSVSQKITKTGDICGSPIYMSPEQILDEKIDARTDIYSFGVVMYETLTGNYLFSGTKITDILEKHVNARPTPLSKSVPQLQLPTMLEVAIFKTLEKDPKDRFQSMAELKEVLSTIQRRISAPVADQPTAASPAATGRDATVALETLAKPSTEVRKVVRSFAPESPAGEELALSAPRSAGPLNIFIAILLLLMAAGLVAYFVLANDSSSAGRPEISPAEPPPVLNPQAKKEAVPKEEKPVQPPAAVSPPASTKSMQPKQKVLRSHNDVLLEEMNATEDAFVKGRHEAE